MEIKEEQAERLLLQVDTLKQELEQARLENSRLVEKLESVESDFCKLSQAIEQVHESVIITDSDSVIEYVNPGFVAMTGYHYDEVGGQKTSLLNSGAQDRAFYETLWQTITKGEAWTGTLIEKKKDGNFYPCLMSIIPVTNHLNEIIRYIAIQKDITKERELEEQFVQAQKMEAIGVLVGGVAHDFNNILAAMQGNVFLAKRKINDPDYIQDKLESIGLLSVSAADMVKQLLTFARKGSFDDKTFSLNTFMKEGFKLIRAAIPENINQLCNTCQEKLIINGDATQLLQVMMNLVNNACHAVQDVENPQIDCELKYYQASDEFMKVHSDLATRDFAHVVVRDNGHGINKAHLKKIFEPFYTTKPVGVGTGLGLSMVFSTVARHGGVVEVETEPGKGTAFHLYLPLDEFELQPVLRQDANIVMGKGEMVLLVDDEQKVREVMALSLENMGYKVTQARNGVEALQLLNDLAIKVDLLISDIIMPSMGGIELLKNIRKRHVEIPAIFISGYDQGEIDYEAESLEKTRFMHKPFDYEPLSRIMRLLLDSSRKGKEK